MINWFPDGIPLLAPITLETLKISLTSSHSRWTSSKADSSASAMSRQQLDKGGNKKNKNGEEKETKTDKFLTMEDYSLQKTLEVPVSLPFYGTTGRPQSVNAAGHRPAFRFLGLKAER